LLGGAVKLTEVVDARVLLRGRTRLRKLGIAIAARRPIMATTIMISTRVKPALREVLIFILLYFLLYAA
jgi:hypothetical protein